MSTRRNAFPVRSIAVVVAVLAAFGLGFALRGGGGSAAPAVPVGEAASPTRWTCSMHPQIILPSNDQKCPICFMDLIPLEEGGDGGLAPGELALSENAAALADTSPYIRYRSMFFNGLCIPCFGQAARLSTNGCSSSTVGSGARIKISPFIGS